MTDINFAAEKLVLEGIKSRDAWLRKCIEIIKPDLTVDSLSQVMEWVTSEGLVLWEMGEKCYLGFNSDLVDGSHLLYIAMFYRQFNPGKIHFKGSLPVIGLDGNTIKHRLNFLT